MDTPNDGSRWSHSTGEMQEFHDRTARADANTLGSGGAGSTHSSGQYSGVEETVKFAITGKPSDLSTVLSSGDRARTARMNKSSMAEEDDSGGECDAVKEKITEAASAETSNVLSSGHKARIRRLNKSNQPVVSGTEQSAGERPGDTPVDKPAKETSSD